MGEKTPRIRPHEKPNKFVKQYKEKLGRLSLVDPSEPEQGWKIDLTSGMPVPVENEHDLGVTGLVGEHAAMLPAEPRRQLGALSPDIPPNIELGQE